jgi:hypothetical protein
MIAADTALQTTLNICNHLSKNGLDYRLTGVAAANFYGYGLGTNVIDIAVESDEAVYEAVKLLELPETSYFGTYDPYVSYLEYGGYIRIQGDVLGEPVSHPLGFKLHAKELLLDRLDIYAGADIGGRIEKAMAFIAMTMDQEKIEKYQHIWNRL